MRKAVIALTLGGIAGAAIVQAITMKQRRAAPRKMIVAGTGWTCEVGWDLLDD